MKRTIVGIAVFAVVVVAVIVLLSVQIVVLRGDVSEANTTITKRDETIAKKNGEIAGFKGRIATLEDAATATAKSLPGKIKEGIKEGLAEAVEKETAELSENNGRLRAKLAIKDVEIEKNKVEFKAEIMVRDRDLQIEKDGRTADREMMVDDTVYFGVILGALVPALIEFIADGDYVAVTTPMGAEAGVGSTSEFLFVRYPSCPFYPKSLLAREECDPDIGFVARLPFWPSEGQETRKEGGE